VRRKWVWRDGAMMEVSTDALRDRTRGANLIHDTADPFRSHADGLVYDSKSTYRKSLKRAGMVEMGNERSRKPEAPPQDWTRELNESWNNLGY
jgi:hypothetical protein